MQDLLVLINNEHLYHFEVQIDEDSNMVVRVFDYNYAEALWTKTVENGITVLKFPKSIVIYLESTENTSTEHQMRLDFADGTSHMFKVPTLRLQDYSAKQLAERKLALLLPFCLLKLRNEVKRRYELGTLEEFAPELNALTRELLDTAERCERDGTMTHEDMRDVQDYTERIFNELYNNYPEIEEENAMTTIDLTPRWRVDVDKAAAKARTEERQNVIRKMKQKNLPLDTIADVFGITIDEVRELAKPPQTVQQS